MTEGTGTSVDGVSEEVARRLRAVGRAVSPEEIGDLWIFPPLADVEHSAEFLLFTRRIEEGKLRLYSARLRLAADPAGQNGDAEAARVPNGNGAGPEARMHQQITEHGSVPADRVPGLVVRLRRRLGDDGEPRHVVIDGRAERWHDLLPASGNGHGNGHGNGRTAPNANGDGAVEAADGRP